VELLEREAALAALRAAREAAERGHGRVACVSGEPGIGKSSLVRRFADDAGGQARVLFGSCDDLTIPRPLGPFRDLSGSVSAELDEALRADAAPHELQALLLVELERPPRPAVLVIEDVHWADDATLDSIAVVSRRIAELPALLVLTLRGGELPPGHPLHAALGAVRAEGLVMIELEPLSRGAVAALAGDDAEQLYTATGGNPFYVTELLAARDSEAPPASVANAVLGRMARLDADSRRLVELASVVPGRVATSVLDTVMPGWPAAAEEPERRQLLEVEPASVHFRHELARNVIRASLPAAARRRLHAEILGALLAADADPADVVHHAEAAGAEEVVSEYALVAARRAATLESNREAFSHFQRAADFFDRLDPDARAEALEELALAAYLVGRLDHAFGAIEQAIAIHADSGDRAAIGRCTRVLSRLYWFSGDGEPARAEALEAVAILEPLGESVELARAYSGVSQLAMLEDDAGQAIDWGERALELAVRLGDESTRAHSLVNIACAKVQRDRHEAQALLEAHTIADAAGEREDATRALGNLGYVLMSWGDPRAAQRHAERALAYAERHEVHAYVSYVKTLLAWMRLRAGDWGEAERITRGEVERGITVVQLLAKTVLTELAVRRGDGDASARLADLTAHAERAAELQRVAPVVELMAERALTGDGRMPIERFEQLAEVIAPGGALAGRYSLRLAGWAAVADIAIFPGDPGPGPYAAMRHRDWQAAADSFGELGWSHDRALMLSLTDDEEALGEALDTARMLGAAPLTRRLSERMRELGMRVPQGPRRSTRANPAGLTPRQLEVLALLSEGLSNAEIAERLVVSPRTAEHHVSAVLTKLDAGSRRDVARRAGELGII
jgi:DNA-binding CsgD family transcriptional regulator/tetratricopeptide (TPR) repeat protein